MPERSFPGPFASFTGEAGEWFWRGDRQSGTRRAIAMLAQPDTVGNRHVMLALAKIPPGQAAPWHLHEDFEEFCYFLSGEGVFCCEGQKEVRVAPGSVNVIAPGTLHCHRPTGDEDLLFLWGYAPPGEQLSI